MFRLAVKSVRHNPKRLILTAVAVALGVSLVAASFTFTNALSSGFSGLFSEIYAGTDVIGEPDPDSAESTDGGGGDPFNRPEGTFEPALVDEIAAIEGVDAAFGGVQVMGSVLPPETAEAAEDPFAAPGAPSQIYNWSEEAGDNQTTLVDGRGPQARGEIVLDLD